MCGHHISAHPVTTDECEELIIKLFMEFQASIGPTTDEQKFAFMAGVHAALSSTEPSTERPISFNCNWAPEGCDCTDYCKRRSEALTSTEGKP